MDIWKGTFVVNSSNTRKQHPLSCMLKDYCADNWLILNKKRNLPIAYKLVIK